MNIIGQDKLIDELGNIFRIFQASNATIRPHFILTGESGSGKTLTVKTLCEQFDFNYIEVNAAALTKEGTSGNSLSKALSPLLLMGDKMSIVFVDEFDKLFISGNHNTDLAHESTNGVQNEFLKVLESDKSSVFGDYGKYIPVSTGKCLFVFAGAFNGQPNITVDDLREFGIKTEFIGRVGLCFNAVKLTLENLYDILDESPLLSNYLSMYKDISWEDVIGVIRKILKENYKNNTIGARQINTLIHQYFIYQGDMSRAETVAVFHDSFLGFEEE